MDSHNYPADSRMPEQERAARRQDRWASMCGVLLAMPLILGGAWFLLAWLVVRG
jgi:hypothetical protein